MSVALLPGQTKARTRFCFANKSMIMVFLHIFVSSHFNLIIDPGSGRVFLPFSLQTFFFEFCWKSEGTSNHSHNSGILGQLLTSLPRFLSHSLQTLIYWRVFVLKFAKSRFFLEWSAIVQTPSTPSNITGYFSCCMVGRSSRNILTDQDSGKQPAKEVITSEGATLLKWLISSKVLVGYIGTDSQSPGRMMLRRVCREGRAGGGERVMGGGVGEGGRQTHSPISTPMPPVGRAA